MSETPRPTQGQVRHEPDQQRFALAFEGATAILEYRKIDAPTLDYHHTFVPTALRGRGLASRLTEFALEYARKQGLKIVPTCPFVATFVQRNPRYRSVVRD
jgi:predicted GNAT family acetyltransferase